MINFFLNLKLCNTIMFADFASRNLRKIVAENRQQILRDAAARECNLIKKIDNFIARHYLSCSTDEILDRITSDEIFAACFEKSPLRQNFYETQQLAYLQTTIPDVKKVSNQLYVDADGKLAYSKSASMTKSIDFVSASKKTLYAAKHIADCGGAQDNQFADLQKFAEYWQSGSVFNSSYNEYEFCLLISGQYFTAEKILTLQNYNANILNLNTEVLLPSKTLAQHYTTNYKIILQDVNLTRIGDRVIEPFVGNGDLLPVANKLSDRVVAYDIQPRVQAEIRDTLLNPPDYTDATVITNPPYLARNKCKDKTVFDRYKCNDLYKCFLRCLIATPPVSGIVIIPLNFWTGMRRADVKLRNDFLQCFAITQLNIFTYGVFENTDYTVCAFGFELAQSTPVRELQITIHQTRAAQQLHEQIYAPDWIIGHEALHLPQNPEIKFVRILENSKTPPGFHETKLHLHSVDNTHRKIKMCTDRIYRGKTSSRTEASYYCNIALNAAQCCEIADKFNATLQQLRDKYCSLFLSNYRENNRKRISFSHAVQILNYCTNICLNQ